MNIKFKKIFIFDDLTKEKINQFIVKFNGTPFHEVEFNTIISDVYKTQFYFLLAEVEDKTVGVCPVHELKSGILKKSYSPLSSHEVAYGGWIFNSDYVRLTDLLEGTKFGLLNKLIYSSNIQLGRDGYEESKISNLKIRKTVILNLNPTESEILSGFKSRHRNRIGRATRKGVTIEEIKFDNIEEFYRLSNELKYKKNKEPKPLELYSRILEAYSKKGKGICLAARHQGKLISSMIFIANKNFSIGWVAGRKLDIPNGLYQNELLLWNFIQWSKSIGSNYLDFCGLDEERLPQLARMKLSFSKDIKLFYAFSKSSLLYKVINATKNKTNT